MLQNLMPIGFIILQFCLKAFVSEKYTPLILWRNLLQLPVDLGFLATSFLFMSLIVHPDNIHSTSMLIVCFIVINIVTIILWKCTPKGLESIAGCKFWINSIISVVVVIIGISVIKGWSLV